MQIELFPNRENVFIDTKKNKSNKETRTGTFVDNMKLPIHRWFRYSAGFSAEWVENVILDYKKNNLVVLDPFSGSGTTVLAAEHIGVKSYGFESHPFISKIAKAKLLWNKVSTKEFLYRSKYLVKEANNAKFNIKKNPILLKKCYSEEALLKLSSLKEIFLKTNNDEPIDKLIWLSITSILRSCSHVGTAQWQYILPNKTKSKVLDPFDAFIAKSDQIANDIIFAQSNYLSNSSVIHHDSRNKFNLPNNSVDLVITSPPYPNNYDYADAARLEMTFWGDINSWSDLNSFVRKFIIRSCSQHSAADKINLEEILSNDYLHPIVEDIEKVCHKLAEIRLTKGGKKTYHTMIAAYFFDISKVMQNLRYVCKNKSSKLCFVIGDSAPYGIHVPTEQWIERLAIYWGFEKCRFEKIRDRNVKWKNRKHNVPLQEGRLWIDG